MQTVHVVWGSSGAYSDRSDWDVKAFERKEDAEAFCAKLHAMVSSIQSTIRAPEFPMDWKAKQAERKKIRTLDPECDWCDYDDVEYSVREIPFVHGELRLPTGERPDGYFSHD